MPALILGGNIMRNKNQNKQHIEDRIYEPMPEHPEYYAVYSITRHIYIINTCFNGSLRVMAVVNEEFEV